MIKVKPFRALRPESSYAESVSSLPYDVVSEKEARDLVSESPLSFMKVVRPEVNFKEGYEFSGYEVYEKAAGLLTEYVEQGIYIEEDEPCFYVYRQMAKDRIQTGLVACFSADDYMNGTIKQHEQTRKSKEEDRICHINICNANTGPVYLAYKDTSALRSAVEAGTLKDPLYDFTANDGVRHIFWKISEEALIEQIINRAKLLEGLYIADGHHRAASSAAVCRMRRKENPDYTGDEEFNWFMAVAFPYEDLLIMPYYRVVKDLNGLSREDFLKKLSKNFVVEKVSEDFTENERKIGIYQPARKNEAAMYLDGQWYRLNARAEILKHDPVGTLDVTLLQENVLGPVLGIDDPRTSDRIDFVGGIRGMGELERRCADDMRVAFALYPTSMEELMAVADEGLYMPPKSTWFEPKLQSGLFIHRLDG